MFPLLTNPLDSPAPAIFEDGFPVYVAEGALFILPQRPALTLQRVMCPENSKNLQQTISTIFSLNFNSSFTLQLMT